MATTDNRPDLEPGFWPSYREPSPMARAIQMPLDPPERWINGVLNAHRQKTRLKDDGPEDFS